MHHFAGADDGVDRADLNANRAAGTFRFVNDGDGIRFLLAIDGDFIFHNGHGISTAAVETTFGALGLRQYG